MRAEVIVVLLLGTLALGFRCPTRDGLYADPTSCRTFYHCAHWTPFLVQCPHYLHFDERAKVCVWPAVAGCLNEDGLTSPTAPTPSLGKYGEFSTSPGNGRTTVSRQVFTTTDNVKSVTEAPKHDNHRYPLEYPAEHIETAKSIVSTETLGTSLEDHPDAIREVTDVENSPAFYWQRWRFNESLPHEVLRVDNRKIADPRTGELIKVYSAIVKIAFENRFYIGATLGPNGNNVTPNNGVYFIHNTTMTKANHGPFWILCVRRGYENKVIWRRMSRNDLTVPKNAISSGEFLIAKALGLSPASLFMRYPGGVTMGSPMFTPFPKPTEHNSYEILCTL